jgi:hypothetical protein
MATITFQIVYILVIDRGMPDAHRFNESSEQFFTPAINYYTQNTLNP